MMAKKTKATPKKTRQKAVPRLGLEKQVLNDIAIRFGKKPETAKKASMKSLEEFITIRFGGKGAEVPTFSPMQQREIRRGFNEFGEGYGTRMLGSRIAKATDTESSSGRLNFMRASIAYTFAQYIDFPVTNNMVEELMKRQPKIHYREQSSGANGGDYGYPEMFRQYAEELTEERERKQNKKK